MPINIKVTVDPEALEYLNQWRKPRADAEDIELDAEKVYAHSQRYFSLGKEYTRKEYPEIAEFFGNWGDTE
jgi:hypothetical protein